VGRPEQRGWPCRHTSRTRTGDARAYGYYYICWHRAVALAELRAAGSAALRALGNNPTAQRLGIALDCCDMAFEAFPAVRYKTREPR
jgi:hypothetical protein